MARANHGDTLEPLEFIHRLFDAGSELLYPLGIFVVPGLLGSDRMQAGYQYELVSRRQLHDLARRQWTRGSLARYH
jgi:hypothetical protein